MDTAADTRGSHIELSSTTSAGTIAATPSTLLFIWTSTYGHVGFGESSCPEIVCGLVRMAMRSCFSGEIQRSVCAS